jgi:hypothetical protein
MMVLGTPYIHWMRAIYNSAYQNEMSRLGKPVDDYPDGVKLVGRERQTHNKIHNDVFPFPCRNTPML